MSHRPIEAGVSDGRSEDASGRGVSSDLFREALSHWPSGVTIMAVRDETRVYATTASSFASVSVEPPQVVVSLGAGAQVLPFVRPGTRFGVSILGPQQRRLATIFADPLPVGPSPFPAEGVPLVVEAPVGLVCSAVSILPADPARLVLARVEEARIGGEGPALIYYRRSYRILS